ncbi:response regulator [Streptomyces fuscigenes]|uniref:response regulator n=1 Tax=Streptomyces fuscigenes TaxID=1528880 RepID=UPI001F176417|nr:response regulator transcription factor [Streptomyces fuscigenes]MCF3960256.1 response regulator transcription factor [Streptomyces fuscigenes]
MTIRVLLADDQELVRTGFRLILQAQQGIEVVGEAADGGQAVRLATELRPDVTLMDVSMPVLDGLEATRRLAGPDVADPLRVVVVTTYDLDENVYAALRAGACGFLLKDSGPHFLIEAVQAAAKGDSLLAPSVTTRLLKHFTDDGAARPARRTASADLTPRELDVVREVAHGRTNAEICESLSLSATTVKAHLTSAQRKIGLRNRTEVAVWAWESRLVR